MARLAIQTEEGVVLAQISDQYRPSPNASNRIIIRRLDEVLVGQTFSHEGCLFRKMNSDCGVRKAKGRDPKKLTYLDPSTRVL